MGWVLRATALAVFALTGISTGCGGGEFEGKSAGGAAGTGGGGAAGRGGSAGVGGTTGVGGGNQGCPGSQVCVEVPTGWEGPVALNDKPADPTCSGDWAIEVLTGNEALTAKPAAQCNCDCDKTGLSCSSEQVSLFSDDLCNSGCNSIPLDASCHANLPTDCNAGTIKGFKLDASVNGNCAAKLSVTKPNLQYAGTGKLCSPSAVLSACPTGSGVCAPQPSGGLAKGVCVHASGDQACPAGFTSRRVVLYTGLDDTRGCVDDCKCGPVRCGFVSLYVDQTCTASIAGSNVGAPNAQCIAAIGSAGSYKYTSLPGCNSIPGATTPSGEVTQKDPVTVCCL